MYPLSLPVDEEDLARQRRMLAAVLRPWARHDDLADALGVARSAVTQWVGGARRPELHVFRAAVVETRVRYPARAEHLANTLVTELLDLAGRWVPAEPVQARSWLEESHDLLLFHARLGEAVICNDRQAMDQLAERAHREIDEALAAARATLLGGP